jgi:DNA-binding transcriptional regulator YiaG
MANRSKKRERRCEECGAPVVERKSTAEQPYRDDLIGLPGVALIGVTVLSCPNGHDAGVVIPRLGGLLDAIARELLERADTLTGPELRYLRKYAGMSAQKFAELLDIDPAHLSRVENERTAPLSRSLEKLARAIVAAAKQKEATKAVLLVKSAEAMPRGRNIPMFRLERNRWRPAA